MNGALIVDKPAGPTSHDAVSIVRRAIGIKKIGHTGTLDPLATGVLVLLVGRATRLAQFVNADEKEYVAGVRLGLETETDDAEQRTVIDGRIDRAVLLLPHRPDPSRRLDVWNCTPADVEAALADFRGTYLQAPPAVSAKKVAGTRAYTLARRRERVELKPVEVTVRTLDLISYEHGLARLRVVCSAGFYVRALARDVGRRLGCGAHLESLRRTRAGRFALDSAVPLDAIAEQGARAIEHLVPMNGLLEDMPSVRLTEAEAERASHGNPIARDAQVAPPLAQGQTERVRLVDGTGALVAVAERRAGGVLHPVVVLV